MKALIVLGHPAPGSFNHALAATICETWANAGGDVTFNDPLHQIWRTCILGFCGVPPPRMAIGNLDPCHALLDASGNTVNIWLTEFP